MLIEQKKVMNIYNFIKKNLYLCQSDMDVGGVKLNSNLLFGILTMLVNGKELVFGEYGLGKTTSSESLTSLFYGIPREVVLNSVLRGHPEQTEEKMIGRPDLGALNQGKEEVIWSYFSIVKPKIIDEFNRLPASKQNILLEGIDRGNWKYLNSMMMTGDLPLFATCNYRDSGNQALIPPVLDRFDVALEVKHPGINNSRMILLNKVDEKVLNDQVLSKEMLEMIEDKSMSIEEKGKRVDEIRGKYRTKISDRLGLRLLCSRELTTIRSEIESLKISREALMFFDLAIAELTSCQEFGQKRLNEECNEGCHYRHYLCGKIIGCISIRFIKSLIKYAKALAWLLGEREVDNKYLQSIMPYALWHRINYQNDYLESYSNEKRREILEIFMSKEAVKELDARFKELSTSQTSFIDYIKKGGLAKAVKLAEKRDHPVFKEYLKVL